MEKHILVWNVFQAMYVHPLSQIAFRACRHINVSDIVWEQDWLMSINSEKYEILREYQKRTTFLFTYTLHGVPLKIVPNTKYLHWRFFFIPRPEIELPYYKVTPKGDRTLAFLKRNQRVNSLSLLWFIETTRRPLSPTYVVLVGE